MVRLLLQAIYHEELPLIQQLHEQTADNPKLQVLTFNVTLPQNWLVKPDGQVRWVDIGFTFGAEETWKAGVMERFKQLAGAS